MPSPFPGMDPWLEDPKIFPDLHDSLIFLIKEALNRSMPPGYVTSIKRIVWTEKEKRREPDVSVLNGKQPDSPSSALTTLPGLVAVETEPKGEAVEQTYLEVRTDRDRRLVTAIEILSLSNKTRGNEGFEAYKNKQSEFYAVGVNLVEIDLLRSGTHATAILLERLETIRGEFDYHIAVTVHWSRVKQCATTFTVKDRLPAIGIPLDEADGSVMLDLQSVMNHAYDAGLYERLADYTQPPTPPLTPELQEWANSLLKHE